MSDQFWNNERNANPNAKKNNKYKPKKPKLMDGEYKGSCAFAILMVLIKHYDENEQQWMTKKDIIEHGAHYSLTSFVVGKYSKYPGWASMDRLIDVAELVKERREVIHSNFIWKYALTNKGIHMARDLYDKYCSNNAYTSKENRIMNDIKMKQDIDNKHDSKDDMEPIHDDIIAYMDQFKFGSSIKMKPNNKRPFQSINNVQTRKSVKKRKYSPLWNRKEFELKSFHFGNNEEYKYYVIIDGRESSKKDYDIDPSKKVKEKRIHCMTKGLPVGDACIALINQKHDTILVFDWIMERKTYRDFMLSNIYIM